MDALQAFMSAVAEINESVRRFPTPETIETLRAVVAKLPRISQALIDGWPKLDSFCGQCNASLADRGWYVAGQIPASHYAQLIKALSSSNETVVDQLAADYARSRIDGLNERIECSHPARHAIISDAIDAHQSKKYTLSIPTLLA
jgi:hypothetical protein